MTENAFFRAFTTLRSQFHLHHRSQRALTEIVSKICQKSPLTLRSQFHLHHRSQRALTEIMSKAPELVKLAENDDVGETDLRVINA